MQTNKSEIKSLLQDRYDILYKRAMICNLNRPFFHKQYIQVHCDDFRAEHSQLYGPEQLDEAIDKFLELKRKIR